MPCGAQTRLLRVTKAHVECGGRKAEMEERQKSGKRRMKPRHGRKAGPGANGARQLRRQILAQGPKP